MGKALRLEFSEPFIFYVAEKSNQGGNAVLILSEVYLTLETETVAPATKDPRKRMWLTQDTMPASF